ncbi:MAG TPA: enoyl-CoA hydratase-related protein [Ktedonobacteraceae bacterium]|jgi:2-(1,2-epoxy-1,2-dihydrophenyl)acetyl-CoA isomerase|nr:enoyl-CoA hydratase-related protein [Ktedonobacteraceae bacterium]
MRTDYQNLLVKQDGGVVTLTMNRPEVLNAFNDTMLEALTGAVEEAARDESVRCVVITGAGRAFGSGQDLKSLSAARETHAVARVSEHLQKYHRLVLAIRNMPKPVIAAVRGVAAGISCNIALACDLRVATEDARFIEAFARIALVPDGGGGYFLPRLIGVGKAMEMSMLADEVSGPEAERIGLVNKCVPAAEFEATVNALAQRLANGPTRAYALIKELIYTSAESDLQTSLQLEGELQDNAFETEDHRNAVQAFLEKRKPEYKGR